MYLDNYRELARAILTQAYQDYGETIHNHVCTGCWKRWTSTESVSVCPKCGERNEMPTSKRYSSSGGVRIFLNSDWCRVLCDGVDVPYQGFKTRVLRYSRVNPIVRGETDARDC